MPAVIRIYKSTVLWANKRLPPPPSSISIDSAIFAWLIDVTKMKTNRQTMPHQDIYSYSPHLAAALVMWPINGNQHPAVRS